MEKFCDLINNALLDIFSIFSLGMRKPSSSMQYCLLFINTSVPLVILGFYMAKGSFFISYDALSKATDILEMSLPFSVHFFVMISQTKNCKVFNKMIVIMDSLDETFKNLQPQNLKSVKISSTFLFLVKFFIVHLIGCGIESFTLMT